MANKKELDPQLLKVMFKSIRKAEIENVKTQKKDDKGMIRILEDYINKKVQEEMREYED